MSAVSSSRAFSAIAASAAHRRGSRTCRQSRTASPHRETATCACSSPDEGDTPTDPTDPSARRTCTALPTKPVSVGFLPSSLHRTASVRKSTRSQRSTVQCSQISEAEAQVIDTHLSSFSDTVFGSRSLSTNTTFG